MTDTYDKENYWYGWNGGECPVHPETEVQWVSRDRDCGTSRAKNVRWSHYETDTLEWADIIAFRITRLYREPRPAREWWVRVTNAEVIPLAYDTERGAEMGSLLDGRTAIEVIHVREVLEDE